MIDVGDEVTIQSGMFSGKQGEIREIDRDMGIVTVAVEGFGAERETRVPVDDVEEAGGDPEELMEEVEERVREAVRQPFGMRRNLWWARRAADGEEPSEELLDDFEEARDEIEGEYDRAVSREIDQVTSDLSDADAVQIQRWLHGTAESLERTWRSRAEARQKQFLSDIASDEEIQELRREAIEQGADEEFLDDEALADRAVDRLVSEMVDEGLELWNECEERRSLVEGGGYRWESVEAGGVDLEAELPKGERPERSEGDGPPSPRDWTLPGDPTVWGRVLDSEINRMALANTESQALVTRTGTVEQFGDNPWDIPSDAGVADTLDAVFGPLEDRMVHAHDALHRRCLAVAHLETDHGPRLAYLVFGPAETYDLGNPESHWPQAVPYDEMADRVGDGFPALVVGSPPDQQVEVELEDDETFDLPMSLRELRSRHGVLWAPRMWVGEKFETLEAVAREDTETFREQNDGAAPDQFVAFGRDENGNGQVLDLDELDKRHDPMVAGWDHDNGTVGQRYPFWLYFDAILRGMMGIVPEG